MTKTLTIKRPDDFHIHFRQDNMLKRVVNKTADVFARAMVMPNTDPSIDNGGMITDYHREIISALTGNNHEQFEPLMTFKITPRTGVGDVISAKSSGAIAGKLYPDGVTTGSEGGVRNFEDLFPVYEQMSKSGLVLSLHGEHPDAFCLDREVMFLEILERIVDNFPDLKIVMEHLSTKAAVYMVCDLPGNVAATITVHHLELTHDDLVGGKLKPHFFCKPLAKRGEDRDALLWAATSGNPKFFFGSDSAPHQISDKECAECCAGVYSAPVALPALAQIFESAGSLDMLEGFVSHFGADFYGLPRNEGEITIVKKPWEVRQACSDLVPYKLGETLNWQIQHD